MGKLIPHEFCHYVAYTFCDEKGRHGSGASEIINDVKEYRTRAQVRDLMSFLARENGWRKVIVSTIFTVKNI